MVSTEYSVYGAMLGTYVHEGSNGAVHSSLVQVGIVQDHRRRLTAQLQEHGLDVLTSGGSNDRADHGATGEVDLAHGRVGNQSIGHRRSIAGLVENNIQTSSRQTCLAEDFTKDPEALGGELGALKDDGVTGG